MIPRLTFLVLAGLLQLTPYAYAGETSSSRPRPPNILFIYTDDQSKKLISSYEGAYAMARTPNIDQLAASGIRFEAAYMGAWCMPSRATLLTGLHPHAIETMRLTGPNPQGTYDPRSRASNLG